MAMTVSGLRNSKGFTLVEVMVAIAILSIALLGLVSVTVMVIKSNSFSKEMTKATTLANDKMEDLKKSSYSGLVSGTDTKTDPSTDTSRLIYTKTWTVTQNSPIVGTKTIDITVQWNSQGTSHNVTVRNIIAQ